MIKAKALLTTKALWVNFEKKRKNKIVNDNKI